MNALEQVAIQELATFEDVFSWFALKMRVGWDEKAFVWSDMLHYRRTNQMAHALLEEAQRQFQQNGDETKFAQFQAFALGWICHIGTDVIDHSFVNEQCGGPFRTGPVRAGTQPGSYRCHQGATDRQRSRRGP